jgi:hypothetical protein
MGQFQSSPINHQPLLRKGLIMSKHKRHQKGNPHEIAFNQHVFPVESIRRFANESGYIQLYRKEEQKSIPVQPSDRNFCADEEHAWDQASEKGFMYEIETGFQVLANEICNGKRDLNESNCNIISKFYILWNVRWHWSRSPTKDYPLPGVLDAGLVFKDKNTQKIMNNQEIINIQNLLERHYINFIDHKASLESCFVKGLHIHSCFLTEMRKLKDTRWAIMKAQEGEFIVPDNSSKTFGAPLTPNMWLMFDAENATLNLDEVRARNRVAIESSCRYYFARHLGACPT